MGFVHPPTEGWAGKTGLPVPQFLDLTMLTAVGGQGVQCEDGQGGADGAQPGAHQDTDQGVGCEEQV